MLLLALKETWGGERVSSKETKISKHLTRIKKKILRLLGGKRGGVLEEKLISGFVSFWQGRTKKYLSNKTRVGSMWKTKNCIINIVGKRAELHSQKRQLAIWG